MSKTMTVEENEILNRKFADIDEDCIKYLERILAPAKLVKRTADGSQVDVNATLVACGAYEAMVVIRHKVELGGKAK